MLWVCENQSPFLGQLSIKICTYVYKRIGVKLAEHRNHATSYTVKSTYVFIQETNLYVTYVAVRSYLYGVAFL